MDIGEHCTLSRCAILTFLPITCPYCRASYCQQHFLPLQHDCAAPGAADADKTLSDTEILKRVQRANQRRTEIQASVADKGEGSSTSEQPTARPATGPSSDDSDLPSRLPCQFRGCKRFSLQMDLNADAALSQNRPLNVQKLDGNHVAPRAFTHAAPRCDRCRGFFCMPHRSAVAHKCQAPPPKTEGEHRREAADERKRRAQEVLAKHFPNRAGGSKVAK